MTKYIVIGLLALLGVGYVVADERYLSGASVTDCCANGFDATSDETTPQP